MTQKALDYDQFCRLTWVLSIYLEELQFFQRTVATPAVNQEVMGTMETCN